MSYQSNTAVRICETCFFWENGKCTCNASLYHGINVEDGYGCSVWTSQSAVRREAFKKPKRRRKICTMEDFIERYG